jgi:SAM-dependent methyltransferase
MACETTKALARRLRDPRFAERIFVGCGIDIGAGPDPLAAQAQHWPRMERCDSWDVAQGDAQEMQGVPPARYDFVHSSHCLEHLRHPGRAVRSWWRILKPGGHLVVMVPDEDLYEQGVWPSTFNPDHKHTFTIRKPAIVGRGAGWSPVSVAILDLCDFMEPPYQVVKLELLDEGYDYARGREDQTLGPAEAGIELVVQKRRA